ncbi:MAG TPA: type III-B CRISPR module RAMP protein Cmr1 [Terriglobales bacterium]|nr:type III-B CRISPR module RAMP protein Cmr1 [Terriglobales bacterium]
MEVVTPILGGGTRPREIDGVDVIRPAAVRGHLRFWWRALHGHGFETPSQMYSAEREIWGGAATDEGGRSAVEVGVRMDRAGDIDPHEIDLRRTPGAYALWPARSERRTRTPVAARRSPGTRFHLTVRAPRKHESAVQNSVRAWLLFGGYGGRTRRGLGSFAVTEDQGRWLPETLTVDSFALLFGHDIFAPPPRAIGDVPWLAGASLQVGGAVADPGGAWTIALDWLREFRQGTTGGSGQRAREPGDGKPQPRRPSISNWPEADKIRHLADKITAHRPRHNGTPTWPRAGFGLPIIGQFQTNPRDGNGQLDEPGKFELGWRRGEAGAPIGRLASPLIVKALPLASGSIVPCALWLHRAYPAGEVVLKGFPNSAAPFDRMVAEGDDPCFSALGGKANLRAAFLGWLHAKYHTAVVS